MRLEQIIATTIVGIIMVMGILFHIDVLIIGKAKKTTIMNINLNMGKTGIR